MEKFPKARVHHSLMSISDHCLLILLLKKRQTQKLAKKNFFFEVMWMREEGCREVGEIA